MGKAEHSRSLGATGEARVHQTGKEDLDNHVSHLLVLQRLQSVSVITSRQQGGGGSVVAKGRGRVRRSARRLCWWRKFLSSSVESDIDLFQFITSGGSSYDTSGLAAP